MISTVTLVVLVLASFRLTRFIVSDSLIEHTRERFIAWTMQRGEPTGARGVGGVALTKAPPLYKTKLFELVTCPYCVGIYTSFAVTLVALRHLPWTLGSDGWLLWLGVAGGQALCSHFSAD